MDNIPPALARLQHMSQDVIGGRNALTPVLKRDDAIREWERRQTGKVVAAQPYPQLEYLHQQAEIVASQGLANWHPGPGGGNRYTGAGGSGQPPTSALAHAYHIPQTNQPLVVEEDRRDVVMSSVRNAARSDGPNTAFGAASDAVTSPSQVYTSTTTTRYPTYPQSSQQSQTSSDISNLYVPMQPDQFAGYPGSSTQSQATNRVVGGGLGGSGPPPLPAAFYAGGVNTSGPVQGGVKDARKQSNPEIWPR